MESLPHPPLTSIRHIALDMDGTIYRGETILPETLPFLALLRQLRIGYTFLTNNPSRNNADYQAKLQAMGIQIDPSQIYTSTEATIEYLRQRLPSARRLFILGTPSMSAAFASAGFALVPDDPAERPDAVVVGFDTRLTYARLCRAAWWIANGIDYIATNPDRICPTDQPTTLVDCGSITAALETATGRAPVAVMGKPDVAMLQGILRRHSLKPNELAMVGDRLYTDIEMARRAGAIGVLVLTGETTPAQAASSKPPPDLVVATLAELGKMLSA
jgi:NagD protein